MNIRIYKSTLSGTACAPPSKSYAHRMLICAALAEGRSRINGISESEDMLATLDCMSALGCIWKRDADEIITERSAPFEDAPDKIFYCRESGSTLRFFIPIAMALKGGGTFKGTQRLIERGAGIYGEVFAGHDVSIKTSPAENTITVKGTLSSGTYRIRGDVSSQFISGLMFALSVCEGESLIEIIPPVESRPYIDITADSLRLFGAGVKMEDENVCIISGGGLKGRDVSVEGDWSNAAFLYAFNCAAGGNINVTGLSDKSFQGDRICTELFERLKNGQGPIDISLCPDLGPVLFSAAAAMGCGAAFTGTRRLRIKESDRAAAMAQELLKFSISCRVGENDMYICPGQLKAPKEPLNGHGDHRIVMSLALLSSITGGVIEGCEAVRKSWPEFFETMKSLGLKTEIINEF